MENPILDQLIDAALLELIKDGYIEQIGDKYRLTEKGLIYKSCQINSLKVS